MSAIEQRDSSGRDESMGRTQTFILRSARAVNPVIAARGVRAQSDQERSLQSGPSPAKRLACGSWKILKARGYALTEDGCLTDCSGGVSASSATPKTTSTAEPIKKPARSLGM
jgi:hypothetical protein